MSNRIKNILSSVLRIILTMLFALGIGAILIILMGQNPIEAFGALFRGAFVSKRAFGTTLASLTPLLLTTVAFSTAAKAGAFNVGVEGEVFLGGIVAAYIGINWTFLPKPMMLVACFVGAMLVGAIWAFIPGFLKAIYNVNEVCVTILMNSIATYICSYLVSGPMSAGVANARSKDTLVTLPKILKPSNANVGLFIAILVVLLIIFMLNKTTIGYKIKAVGTNPANAEYAGINPRKVFIGSMMLSGLIGGLAGCIEVLGVYGYYLNNFAANLGTNGMLASLIVKNNVGMGPFMAFFLAVLKSGAMGMQQNTGVPKSVIDMISAIFIIIATMEMMFVRKKRKKINKVKAAGGRTYGTKKYI